MNNIKLNNFYIGESVEFMRENIEDGFVDLTVTSPPYSDLRKYKGFTFDYESMIKELYRVTKSGGVVVWVVGDKTHKGSETLTSFKQAIYAKDEVGFKLHDTMIYAKQNPIPLNHNRYEQQFEYMFIFAKEKLKTFNSIKEECKQSGNLNKMTHRKNTDNLEKASGFGKQVKKEKIKTNIWYYNNSPTKDKIAFNHPAIFHEQLANDHILSWSNEGDIILDPMCGAGTTAKMAYLNKRNFIGVDMSEEYINEICVPRLEMYGWNKSDNIIF